MNSSDKQFEHRVRALYLEATQRLDPVTTGRLRAARRSMLQEGAGRYESPAPRRARMLLPVGAIAAIALAALMTWQPTPHPQDEVQPQAQAGLEQDEYLPPEADKTDPGLYQNLGFYSWLAANDSSQNNR